MVKVLGNTFEGGTNGTVITPANSGGASGNALTFVGPNAPSEFVYSNAHPWGGGGLSCRFTPHASTSYYLRWDEAADTTTRRIMMMDFQIPSTPTGNTVLFQMRARTSQAILSRVEMDNQRRVIVYQGGGAGAVISSLTSPALALGQKITLALAATQSADSGATGTVEVRITGPSGEVLWAPAAATGVITQPEPAGQFRFFGISASTGWTQVFIDNLEIHSLASGWPVSTAPPTTNVVDSLSHIIDARTSTVGSGTITFAINQTEGPAETPTQLASGLWTVTPHATLAKTYQVTATGSEGGSDTKSVTVPALPASSGSKMLRWNGTAWV